MLQKLGLERSCCGMSKGGLEESVLMRWWQRHELLSLEVEILEWLMVEVGLGEINGKLWRRDEGLFFVGVNFPKTLFLGFESLTSRVELRFGFLNGLFNLFMLF